MSLENGDPERGAEAETTVTRSADHDERGPVEGTKSANQVQTLRGTALGICLACLILLQGWPSTNTQVTATY